MDEYGLILAAAGVIFAAAVLFIARCYVRNQWIKMDKMLSISGKELKAGEYCLDETLDAKLYQRMQDLYRDLELEYKQADDEKEEVKAYIADLSHQMKTPLANLNLYHELIQEGGLTQEELTEFHGKIQNEMKKMEWLLAMLTKITRLETGAINFSVDVMLLTPVIKKAEEAVREQALQKRIEIEVEGDVKERVYMNSKWLLEAIVNILENGIKYSREDSIIKMSVDIFELYVRLNIIDSGIGIVQGDYQKIFKRFYRGKNTADMPGSGLGLYLAQLILNKQNGYITVKSEVGKGSCFSVYLKRYL